MGGERVTVSLRYQTRFICEYIQRMMGKEKTKPKNPISFLPLSWSSFSLESTSEGGKASSTLVSSSVLFTLKVSILLLPLWPGVPFIFIPQGIWFSLGSSVKLLPNQVHLPSVQQLKMPRCQGLQQRKGLFKRQPSGKMGGQVSDAGKGLEIFMG